MPVGRWKGFGGLTDFNGDSFEVFTWAAGLAEATSYSCVLATAHMPVGPPIMAAKQATGEIPIVMAGAEALRTGLIASLSRPGGNITGVNGFGAELGAKQLELIREILSDARRVGVLINAPDPFSRTLLAHIQEAAKPMNIELATFMLETSVLSELTAESCGAVTMRHDAGKMLRDIDNAHLFLIALDDERTKFRYHRLVRDVLSTELRLRDREPGLAERVELERAVTERDGLLGPLRVVVGRRGAEVPRVRVDGDGAL